MAAKFAAGRKCGFFLQCSSVWLGMWQYAHVAFAVMCGFLGLMPRPAVRPPERPPPRELSRPRPVSVAAVRARTGQSG